MPPYIHDFFQRWNPDNQRAYKDGFEAGKRVAEREMKEALKNIHKAEAFVTSTSTSTTI